MKRLTEYTIPETGFSVVSEERYKRILMEEKPSVETVYNRLKKIEDILGDEYDLGRLRELAQADREGRCVVLPCKPSDVTVYQLRNKKHARGIGVSPRHISCATVWAGGHYALHHQGQDDCLGRDFKKTWFLDKAEAQAALRREQDEQIKP